MLPLQASKLDADTLGTRQTQAFLETGGALCRLQGCVITANGSTSAAATLTGAVAMVRPQA